MLTLAIVLLSIVAYMGIGLATVRRDAIANKKLYDGYDERERQWRVEQHRKYGKDWGRYSGMDEYPEQRPPNPTTFLWACACVWPAYFIAGALRGITSLTLTTRHDRAVARVKQLEKENEISML